MTKKRLSVQPSWCADLPLQQQSVLFLATRGPDGVAKDHPCKDVQRAYRACVLLAGRYGRELRPVEGGDSFMSLTLFGDDRTWREVVLKFLYKIDELPHHYLSHLMHGAEILGYKHPDAVVRSRWNHLYLRMVCDLHLAPETEAEMDRRLGDWGRVDWDDHQAVRSPEGWVPPTVGTRVMFDGVVGKVISTDGVSSSTMSAIRHEDAHGRSSSIILLTWKTEGLRWRRLGPADEAPSYCSHHLADGNYSAEGCCCEGGSRCDSCGMHESPSQAEGEGGDRATWRLTPEGARVVSGLKYANEDSNIEEERS